MDECREISFAKSRTKTDNWNVCAGASISGTAALRPGAEVTAELNIEVCGGRGSDASVETTQLVKVPGVQGKTMVASAIGLEVLLNNRYFVSYRTDGFTICEEACPHPTCKQGPAEVEPDPGMGGSSVGARALYPGLDSVVSIMPLIMRSLFQ
mmetsp:Transcript_35160/g.112077  ORF Transcript_35160/g.112077 Transcript_35160/m.112077 type:complete len:153 (+) Transcript_35160:685-1143(+)